MKKLVSGLIILLCLTLVLFLFISSEAEQNTYTLDTLSEWLQGTLNNITTEGSSIKINNYDLVELDLLSIFNEDNDRIQVDVNEAVKGAPVGDGSGGAWDGPPGDSHYWQMDMGQSYMVSKFVIFGDSVGALANFKISDNGIDWQTEDSFLFDPSQEETIDLNKTFRYFKIENPNEIIISYLKIFQPGTGTHTTASAQIDGTASIESWDTFEPTQTTPANTSIQYQFRTSNNGVDWTDWSAAQEYGGVDPIDLSGLEAHRYLQVKSTLTSTDGVSTPQIDDYTIGYTVTDADPCADSESVDIQPSPAGKVNNVSAGMTFTFSSHNYDDGGGLIDTSFNFSISPSVDGFSITDGSGTEGTALWSVPNNIEPGEYTVTVTTGCGESNSVLLRVPSEPEPGPVPPPDACQDFSHVEITPDGGTFRAEKVMNLSARAVKDNGSTMSGAITFYSISEDGGSVTDDGTLTMPQADGRIVVTASHPCGSASDTFISASPECSEYDHIEIVPPSAKVMAKSSLDFNAAGYKADGSQYHGNIAFSYSADKGTITSQGIYTAPAEAGRDVVTVVDDCNYSDKASVKVIDSPDYCYSGQVDFKEPQGAWNREHTTYLNFTKTSEVFGSNPVAFEIKPTLFIPGIGNVTKKTDFSYQPLLPKEGYFQGNTFYPQIESGTASALVTAKYQDCYYNTTIKFVLGGGPGPIPNCGLEVTQPSQGDRWPINSRQNILWTSQCLEEWIDHVKIEFSKDNGLNWQTLTDLYPNTNDYSWVIISLLFGEISGIKSILPEIIEKRSETSLATGSFNSL